MFYIAVEKKYAKKINVDIKPFDLFSPPEKHDKSYFKIIPRILQPVEISFSCGQWKESEILHISQYFNPSKINKSNQTKGFKTFKFSYTDNKCIGILKFFPNLDSFINNSPSIAKKRQIAFSSMKEKFGND